MAFIIFIYSWALWAQPARPGPETWSSHQLRKACQHFWNLFLMRGYFHCQTDNIGCILLHNYVFCSSRNASWGFISWTVLPTLDLFVRSTLNPSAQIRIIYVPFFSQKFTRTWRAPPTHKTLNSSSILWPTWLFPTTCGDVDFTDTPLYLRRYVLHLSVLGNLSGLVLYSLLFTPYLLFTLYFLNIGGCGIFWNLDGVVNSTEICLYYHRDKNLVLHKGKCFLGARRG